MNKTSNVQRASMKFAESIIFSLFENCDPKNKRSVLNFIAQSMKQTSEKYPDRWGAVLHGDCVSFDVGWVQCL
jgi:hypothetical protein